MASKNLLIIVNYNQEKEIRATLRKLRATLAGFKFPIDAVLVDDGSTDRSAAIAREEDFVVLEHPQNRGVGAAIRTGIEYAHQNGFENVAIFSSNGKMQAEDIEKVLTPVALGEADYVTGSRFMGGGVSDNLSLFRSVMIPIFSLFSSIILHRRFSDITCGFRAYKVQWLMDKQAKFNISQEWLDRYELEYYIHFWACHSDLRIKEVPVTIKYSHLEKGRKSHIKPITGWWSMMRPFVYLYFGIRR